MISVFCVVSNKMITQKEVKECLDYNNDTGNFKWKGGREKTGYTNNKGYLSITINKKQYLAHRLAWLFNYGEFPNGNIDHINRIKSDNRISNLRAVDVSTNNRNKGKQHNNKSGYSGIFWIPKRKNWYAQIGGNKNRRYLGSFRALKDAIIARETAEKELGYL